MACALACAAQAGCHRVPERAPPRSAEAIALPAQMSEIYVPIGGDLADVSAALDRAVPRTLWTIDKPDQTCAAPRKVKVLFVKIKTPTIKCRLVGTVTRGAMTLAGHGRTIDVTMPIHAVISARDIGNVLSGETASGDARVRARVRLDIATDWTPHGTVDIHYDWTAAPHVDLLGQRIEITDRADAKLAEVVAKLERTLPAELAKLRVREQVQQAWNSAFTSVQLNRAKPPVWMRITPVALSYGGYSVERGRLALRLGMTARTETVVGQRPPNPRPTALPPLKRADRPTGQIVFTIPVIAAYGELEPVLARALAKRARRPFDVPGIGPVTARFGKVTMYGTDGGRIAVGLGFTAAEPGETPSRGTVWLTAKPVNAVNSRQISFSGLAVSGVTDSTGADLLIRVANAPGLSGTLADALSQNFSNDYQKLLGKIGRAVAEKRTGPLVIRARIDRVRTGQLQAFGRGVYLPVWGSGSASIEVDAR